MSAAAVSLRICLQQAWRTRSLQRADRLRRKRPHGFTSRGEKKLPLEPKNQQRGFVGRVQGCAVLADTTGGMRFFSEKAHALLIRPRPSCRPALLVCLLGGVGYLWARNEQCDGNPGRTCEGNPCAPARFSLQRPEPDEHDSH